MGWYGMGCDSIVCTILCLALLFYCFVNLQMVI